MKITYDKNGTGDNYGIQYKGNIIQLIKALHYLLVVKKIKMPLRSHHGTDFVLVDYKLRFKIAAWNWTHANGGNGLLNMQFIMSDENWYTRLTPHGSTENHQGNLSVAHKTGFLEVLKRNGFNVGDKWNHDNTACSVSVIVEEKADFVAHTKDEYEETFNSFVNELKVMCETYEVLTK